MLQRKRFREGKKRKTEQTRALHIETKEANIQYRTNNYNVMKGSSSPRPRSVVVVAPAKKSANDAPSAVAVAMNLIRVAGRGTLDVTNHLSRFFSIAGRTCRDHATPAVHRKAATNDCGGYDCVRRRGSVNDLQTRRIAQSQPMPSALKYPLLLSHLLLLFFPQQQLSKGK